MPATTCNECGVPQAAARSWYEISPKTGKPCKESAWCGECYEKLHTRYIRELYRKRDEQEAFLNGTSERKAVKVF